VGASHENLPQVTKFDIEVTTVRRIGACKDVSLGAEERPLLGGINQGVQLRHRIMEPYF
jgi:hypothetical protein